MKAYGQCRSNLKAEKALSARFRGAQTAGFTDVFRVLFPGNIRVFGRERGTFGPFLCLIRYPELEGAPNKVFTLGAPDNIGS